MYTHVTKEVWATRKLLLKVFGCLMVVTYLTRSEMTGARSGAYNDQRYQFPSEVPAVARSQPQPSFRPAPPTPNAYEERVREEAQKRQNELAERERQRALAEQQARDERQAALDARIRAVREEQANQTEPHRVIDSQLPRDIWSPAPAQTHSFFGPRVSPRGDTLGDM
jgi:hypothetical protein